MIIYNNGMRKLYGNLNLTAQSQQEINLQNYQIAKASENEAYFFQICQ